MCVDRSCTLSNFPCGALPFNPAVHTSRGTPREAHLERHWCFRSEQSALLPRGLTHRGPAAGDPKGPGGRSGGAAVQPGGGRRCCRPAGLACLPGPHALTTDMTGLGQDRVRAGPFVLRFGCEHTAVRGEDCAFASAFASNVFPTPGQMTECCAVMSC